MTRYPEFHPHLPPRQVSMSFGEETMASAITAQRRSKLASACILLGLLVIAFVLIVVAHQIIDVIDEGLMHKMTIFESEPKEGWEYWRWKHIREALPGWLLFGGIWLAVFGFVLYRAVRTLKHLMS